MLFAKKRLNYILKYMYEGNDIGIMGINDWERIATETEDKGKNTIKSSHFLSCTYVSPLEAMWHLRLQNPWSVPCSLSFNWILTW